MLPKPKVLLLVVAKSHSSKREQVKLDKVTKEHQEDTKEESIYIYITIYRAHGAVMRDCSYHLPKKVQLQALKVALSAKLMEGKIIVIDNEQLDSFKTKQFLEEVWSNYKMDRINNLFILPYQEDLNFKRASNGLKDIRTCISNRLNILKIINTDRLIFTVKSLE